MLKVKTGIESLDALLDGGLDVGSLCFLNAPSMSGKEVLIQEFIYRGLEQDEGCLYVTTSNMSQEIIEEMGMYGFNLRQYENNYVFVDTYSLQSDLNLKDTNNVRYVLSVADFPKLSDVIVNCMSYFLSKGVLQQRIVFDSIDGLLMHTPPPAVYRFLSYIRAKVKCFKAVTLFTLQPDLHDEKAIKAVMELADIMITLDPENGLIEVNQKRLRKKAGQYDLVDNRFVVSF